MAASQYDRAGDVTDVISMLRGGDRRSIGRVGDVVHLLEKAPELFPDLIAGLEDPDPVVRMRSADAIEKISRQRVDLLGGYTAFLLAQAERQEQQEVRWHLAQIIPRLRLTAPRRARSIKIFKSYLTDGSGIVRVSAMQALADLAEHDAALKRKVAAMIERIMKNGTPAVKARGRKLLASLNRGTRLRTRSSQ